MRGRTGVGRTTWAYEGGANGGAEGAHGVNPAAGRAPCAGRAAGAASRSRGCWAAAMDAVGGVEGVAHGHMKGPAVGAVGVWSVDGAAVAICATGTATIGGGPAVGTACIHGRMNAVGGPAGTAGRTGGGAEIQGCMYGAVVDPCACTWNDGSAVMAALADGGGAPGSALRVSISQREKMGE